MEQQQPSTDKDVLRKGITRLMMAIPFLFAGPVLIYLGAGSDHPIIFLMPGIAFCGLAILFIFQGINTILDSMFKTDKRR
ncbi:MAG: DUF6095 family protein [Nonlabens sp.]|uniref:DUF6095 family protein n=1 Tax=Nonlabens sp. TaxID=1888209 RepID=UPI003EF2CE86